MDANIVPENNFLCEYLSSLTELVCAIQGRIRHVYATQKFHIAPNNKLSSLTLSEGYGFLYLCNLGFSGVFLFLVNWVRLFHNPITGHQYEHRKHF